MQARFFHIFLPAKSDLRSLAGFLRAVFFRLLTNRHVVIFSLLRRGYSSVGRASRSQWVCAKFSHVVPNGRKYSTARETDPAALSHVIRNAPKRTRRWINKCKSWRPVSRARACRYCTRMGFSGYSQTHHAQPPAAPSSPPLVVSPSPKETRPYVPPGGKGVGGVLILPHGCPTATE